MINCVSFYAVLCLSDIGIEFNISVVGSNRGDDTRQRIWCLSTSCQASHQHT